MLFRSQKENPEKDLKAGIRQILTDSRWTDISPEMLPSDLDLMPEQVNVSKAPAQLHKYCRNAISIKPQP